MHLTTRISQLALGINLFSLHGKSSLHSFSIWCHKQQRISLIFPLYRLFFFSRFPQSLKGGSVFSKVLVTTDQLFGLGVVGRRDRKGRNSVANNSLVKNMLGIFLSSESSPGQLMIFLFGMTSPSLSNLRGMGALVSYYWAMLLRALATSSAIPTSLLNNYSYSWSSPRLWKMLRFIWVLSEASLNL